ncbi:MAG: prepilin-type N-terminal cleavage/methylation domain-containing protein [Candidatus Omnitrophica bacterium]|jgi:prepilin-type N-terminal cleavage/methylation domain-containing protein|nr:prepilin-type N-terminal cleavage/methylation domain-containing protein [Candidatus Omnitrophota bacterium]MDD5691274.1 prepilin-type N-terminal cleavage/methylation domain-containing protein [Candidatus Omnitrophota bacterium]
MKKGFTLIELIMIIVILGILAAVAVPKYFDLQTSAKEAAEKGVVGGVRAGIYTYFAQNKAYPATLDSAATAACATGNICFDTVLQQGGVTSDWTKASATSYTGPAGNTYTYTAATGDFK